MFGSEVLDVVIGLVFVYILVSIICSAVREGLEAWMKTRATYLEHGIRELLGDKPGEGLARDVFTHPLIFGLFSANKYTPGAKTETPSMFRRGAGLPSYIPSRNFAMTLMDIAARGPSVNTLNSSHNARPISIDSIRHGIRNLQNPRIQRVLLTALDSAQGDLEKVQANLQAWFDSSMDRVSGWYKRSTHAILFVLGLLIAVSMNVDTLAVVNHLYRDQGARAAAVAAAENARADMTYKQAREELIKLKIPIGWENYDIHFTKPANWERELLVPWFGWLLTALAATLGAPFWFDVLNKIMVIRSTVKPREKSREEGSEDRQPKVAPVVTPPVPPTTPATAAGSATTASPPAPPPPDTGSAEDNDEIDACIDMADLPETLDEQLPAAEGGVA